MHPHAQMQVWVEWQESSCRKDICPSLKAKLCDVTKEHMLHNHKGKMVIPIIKGIQKSRLKKKQYFSNTIKCYHHFISNEIQVAYQTQQAKFMALDLESLKI